MDIRTICRVYKSKKAITSVLEKLSNITVQVNDPQLLRMRYKDAEGKETEGMRINSRKRNYALYIQGVPPLYDLARNKGKLYGV